MKTRVFVCALALASLQTACGGGEDPAATPATPAAVFTTGQAASVVIGQTSMTANTSNTSSTEMNVPGTVAVSAAGAVIVAERNNSRVITYNAIPTANGATADTVIGHAAFTDPSTATSTTALHNPDAAVVYGSQLFIADTNNHRVTIYNSMATNAAAAVAIGQTTNALGASPAGPTATTLYYPQGVAVAAGKVAIADGSNNRVVLYNSIPSASGAAADVVLGQANMTSYAHSAATMYSPYGIWTDGTKIAVCEQNGHRCLLWNSWPTANFTAPDIILGQPSLATASANNGGISAHSLSNPVGITSNGTELAIADSSNNRVLYWKTWPTANNQSADLVFGQPDFTTVTSGVSATKLSDPEGVTFNGSSLFVADTNNNRVLIFKKQ